MKNYMKKILAVVLVCMMLVPMAVTSFAATIDTAVTTNWNALATKYAFGTWKLRLSSGAPNTTGFSFTETADGGVAVHTATKAEQTGGYGTTALASKYTTPLDGLTVNIQPTEYDSMIDTFSKGNTLGILWTEDQLTQLVDVTAQTGMYNANTFYSNGFRDAIPTVAGAKQGTPATDPSATPNGKALYVAVQIDKAAADYAAVATSVQVVYYDGYYINADGHPGYRWSFNARNCLADTGNTDATGIGQRYISMDMTNGVTISVRADETLGFIVNVNGVDFCRGENVAYFPDASVDGYGYSGLTDVEIGAQSDKWMNSMTRAKADIDLTGLQSVGEGYLTVGAVSNNDYSTSMAAHRCDYEVQTINGVATTDWKGESASHTCSMNFVETKAATCTYGGGDFYKCATCGKYEVRNATEATGHSFTGNWTSIESATCQRVGTSIDECTVCQVRDTLITPVADHTWGEWSIVTAPTETEAGTQTRSCTVCGATETASIPATGVVKDYTITFDANGGALEGTTEFGINTGDVYGDVLGTLPVPTLANYDFMGWYCEAKDYTLSIGDTFDFSENLTFVAQWQETPKAYTITFDPDGGVMPEGVETSYGINYNDNYKAATGIEYPVPTKEGYVFAGWYWDAYNYTLDQGTWDGGYFAVQQDVALVALWDEDPNYVAGPTVKGTDNYTVTIAGIVDVKEIRFAPGHWTTGAEVRAAEGTLTLSAALVNANTDENGVFKYDVSYACEYTFWVRMNDGTSYFLYADTSDISTYLTADRLRLTVTDMKSASLIKDLWIAQGTWTTYSEIKNNVTSGAKYQATQTKLSNYFATNDFTYTCLAPGAHTVLIRYADGTTEVHHIELTVDVPTFDVNGLQVTIGNIPDVRLIRTAYGEYNSVSEIKKASALRNFNNKTAIKGAEEYMIQYRNEGVITITVEYNTGYQHVEHITITQKKPTVVQDGSTVTIGDLDGLVMVRYAQGRYTTASGIKAAPGAKTLKPESIDANGNIVITNLAAGRYTFMVQYDDESYNFYVIDIA